MGSRSLDNAVVVITGASSGIGRSAAVEFARAGCRVVLAARTESRLREAAAAIESTGARALPVVCDVRRDADVSRLMEAARESFGRVDILICNAGVGLYSRVEEIPLPALHSVFDINFFGVVRCVQAALPGMLQQRSGLIQIVSSVIGRRAIPGYAGYCATKFALGALAESLRLEVQGRGVAVQVVYPSVTDTEFSRNSLIANPASPAPRIRVMSAQKVGSLMVRAARRGVRDEVITFGGKFLGLANGIVPGTLDRVIARVIGDGTPRGVARDAVSR